MRHFCWVYRHRVNGKLYSVQRPGRRTVSPKYLVKLFDREITPEMRLLDLDDVKIFEVEAREFHKYFDFINREDKLTPLRMSMAKAGAGLPE